MLAHVILGQMHALAVGEGASGSHFVADLLLLLLRRLPQTDFNPAFIIHMMQKIDWSALRSTAAAVCHFECEHFAVCLQGPEALTFRLYSHSPHTHVHVSYTLRFI